jgi:PAS domain S-box-containing protein
MSPTPLPEFLARLISNAPLPVVVTDRQGLVTYWGDAAERTFRWTAEEVIGRLDPAIPPKERPLWDAARQRAQDGDAQFIETVRQPRLGDPYEVRVAVIPVPDEPVHACVTICLGDLVTTRKRERAEAVALRERTFSMMIEQMPGLVWSVDQNLFVTSLGGAAMELVGLDPRQAVGQHLSAFISLTEHPAGRAAAAVVRGEPALGFEGTFGGRIFYNRTEPLRRNGEIIGAITVALDITDVRGAREALNVSREELRRISAGMNRVQENERRRIAREVHDELGQRLTGLRIDASLLRAALPREIGSEAEQRLNGFTAQIDDALSTLRRIATELRPPLLDEFGFRAAVEGEISMFRKRTGVMVDLAYDVDERELGPETALALYRIVQESLTNVARHSGATRVQIRIANIDHMVELEIVDNGRGIAAADVAAGASAGLGIAGVRERAYALGGEVAIGPAATGGTRVFISVPLDDLTSE